MINCSSSRERERQKEGERERERGGREKRVIIMNDLCKYGLNIR